MKKWNAPIMQEIDVRTTAGGTVDNLDEGMESDGQWGARFASDG